MNNLFKNALSNTKIKSRIISMMNIIVFCLILSFIVHKVSVFNVDDHYLFALVGWGGFFSLLIHIDKFSSRKRYLIPRRLEDVIRLITAMSLDSHSFKREPKVQEALRGNPISAKTWREVADQHPEFFRTNREDTHIALTMRSYNPIGDGNSREALGITETQKLIDVAITLYEKEAQLKQQYSTWFPLLGAIIGAIAAIITNLFVKGGHG